MVAETFTVLGAIILIGYIGRLAYDRTKIPESIFMIIIGLLLGPVFGVIDPATILPLVPFFSVLALILVLLDAGLDFNVFKVLRDFKSSFLFTILVGTISTGLIGGLAHLVFGWQFYHAVLFGLIASGTTTVAALTLLEVLKTEEKIKNFIFLETVINDFTLIFGSSLLLLLISGQGGDGVPLHSQIVTNIAVALLFGIGIGYAWIKTIGRINMSKLNYISTIGTIFVLYGVTEGLGGDGIIAILVFSFFIGNFETIQRKLSEGKSEKSDGLRQMIKSIVLIHADISFFVKIFFFVLMGLIFDPASVGIPVLAIVIAAMALILLARYVSLRAATFIDKDLGRHWFVITTMIPRGFVATVLAFIPVSQNVTIPFLTESVLLLVLTTNIFAIAATFVYSRFMPMGK